MAGGLAAQGRRITLPGLGGRSRREGRWVLVGAERPTVVWVNGRLVDSGAAAISPLDRGLLMGEGVFDTCLVRHGRPVAFDRHLRRLQEAAVRVGLPRPEGDAVRGGVDDVLAAAGQVDAGRLRITLTGGPAPLGWPAPLGEVAGGRPSSLLITLAPAVAAAEPATVVVLPWVRNERSPLVGVKSTSYAENVVALAEARRLGAQEGILGNTRGELCEATSSNVFLVLGGELWTPPLDSGCLPGVTRELLLEWSAAEGPAVRQGSIPLAALADAPDLLLTSSISGVRPVSRLDGRDLPGSTAGRAAAALYLRRSVEL